MSLWPEISLERQAQELATWTEQEREQFYRYVLEKRGPLGLAELQEAIEREMESAQSPRGAKTCASVRGR